MPSAFASAVSGIRAAGESAYRAAARLQRALPPGEVIDRVTISEQAARLSQGDDGDIVTPLVDLRLARHAVAANAATVRTADEMLEEITKMLDD